jgi:hypothetical protein
MTAKYRVTLSLHDEWPSRTSLAFSPSASFRIAEQYLDAVTNQGKAEDEALAEIKRDFDEAFSEGWNFIEKTIREAGR